MFKRQGKIVAVCISAGGIPRFPVLAARLTVGGLLEDGHRFEEHYLPTRAVTLFSLEQLQAFAKGASRFPPGSVGENLTVQGLNLGTLTPGGRLQIGEAEVQLEKAWTPCHAQHAETGNTQTNSEQHRGFFASVTREGTIRPGDAITVVR